MQKYILLTSQRTGSTYLEQCLNSHPEVRCFGEVLIGYGGHYKKYPPRVLKKYRRARTLWQAVMSGALLNPEKTIKNALSSEEVGLKSIGFRLMYNQMRRDKRVWNHVKNIENLKVIHLYRKNLLKQFVSLKLMHDQSKYGRFSAHAYAKSEIVKINVDASEAMSFVVGSLAERRAMSDRFSCFPSISVYYEEMVAEGGLSSNLNCEIEGFLGVKKFNMSSNQKKMNPTVLEHYVENYDELKKTFLLSPYSNFIDD